MRKGIIIAEEKFCKSIKGVILSSYLYIFLNLPKKDLRGLWLLLQFQRAVVVTPPGSSTLTGLVLLSYKWKQFLPSFPKGHSGDALTLSWLLE